MDAVKAKIQLDEKRLSEIQKNQQEMGFSQEKMSIYESLQRLSQKRDWILALQKKPIHAQEVIAVSKDFGTATLLNVRDAFKSPVKIALYTVFVLAAAFHGFNGLWTFMLTWGLMIKVATQKKMLKVCTALMILIAFLGLSSVWGTYLINLKN
jgi:succinate dehydrogenase / fumarate reductase cytochrome b subunit